MSDEYPTDEELNGVRDFPIENVADCERLLEHLRSLWSYPDYFSPRGDGWWDVSTGGWSGNESLIGALRQNNMFWLLCFQSHRRGGHFEFRVPQ